MGRMYSLYWIHKGQLTYFIHLPRPDVYCHRKTTTAIVEAAKSKIHIVKLWYLKGKERLPMLILAPLSPPRAS